MSQPSTPPDRSQLPALLRLVDDPSEAVKGPVLSALAAFGDELEPALRALGSAPSEAELGELLAAVTAHREALAELAERPRGGRGEPVLRARDRGDGPGAAPAPRYEVGQLVCHRRYGYRGVIVALDETCQADDDWYRRNRTQPARHQPWFHVLVHGSDAITYAAQSNLLPDESTDEVEHPFVELFFRDFADGRYRRNQRPWMDGG